MKPENEAIKARGVMERRVCIQCGAVFEVWPYMLHKRCSSCCRPPGRKALNVLTRKICPECGGPKTRKGAMCAKCWAAKVGEWDRGMGRGERLRLDFVYDVERRRRQRELFAELNENPDRGVGNTRLAIEAVRAKEREDAEYERIRVEVAGRAVVKEWAGAPDGGDGGGGGGSGGGGKSVEDELRELLGGV